MDDTANIIAQQGEIARRRQLMQALQGQNMQTGIQGGGRGNALGQALAKIATAYILANNQKKLAGEEVTNRDQYQQAMQGELSDYMTRRDGSGPQEMQGPMEPGQEDAQRPMMPGTPGNPREAVIRAMASQFPELQAIGKADFAGLRKEQMSAKDMAGLAEKFTPQSIAAYAQTGNPSVLRLNPKQHVVNNALVNADAYGEGKPEVLGDFADKFGAPEQQATDANGKPLIGQREARTGKVAWAPQGQTINVDTKGNSVALNNSPKVFETARDAILTAQDGLAQARRTMQLASDPSVAAGAGAGPQGFIQAVAAKMGWDPTNAAASSQSLMSSLAAQTLKASEALKGAISDKEKPFLEEAKAGRIAFTPQTLQYLAGLAMQANHNVLLNGVQQYNSAASVEGAGDVAKQYPMPALGGWEMPENMFEETVNGRVRYKGTPANPQQKPGASPETALTPAQYLELQRTRNAGR